MIAACDCCHEGGVTASCPTRNGHAVEDDDVREQITQAAGTPMRVLVASTGTGPPRSPAACNGIEQCRGRPCGRSWMTRPGDRGDPLRCPRRRRLPAAHLPYRFTTLALLLREMLQNLGHQQADVLGISGEAGLAPAVRRCSTRAWRGPAADPGGDLNRAAEQTMVPPNPAAAGEVHPAPLWRPVGRKAKSPDATSALRKARYHQLVEHGLPVPEHRRPGVHHAAATAADPPAHPGAHG